MKRILKWTGIALGTLVLLLCVTAAGAYVSSNRTINAKHIYAADPVTIPTDSASITRGGHLVRAITKCVDCHGDNLGGRTFEVGPLGTWQSANLTKGKGGVGSQLSDADFVRALRHGVAPDGRKLLLMPASAFQRLSAEDLGAIVAYVRSAPPVDNEKPATVYGPLFRALTAAGKLPVFEADFVDHTIPIATAIPVAATKEYGGYLASAGGCKGCHGTTLSGGPIPGGDPEWPAAANLTPTGIGARYDAAKFQTLLRTGKRPDGSMVNEAMPYRYTKDMTDDEIAAVWLYLQTVPAKAFGGR